MRHSEMAPLCSKGRKRGSEDMFSSQRPFFFQHGNKSFFVEPRNTWNGLGRRRVFDRVNLDGAVFKHVIDRPMVVIPEHKIQPQYFKASSNFRPSIELNNPLALKLPKDRFKIIQMQLVPGQWRGGGGGVGWSIAFTE